MPLTSHLLQLFSLHYTNQINLFRDACREPTRGMYCPRYTYIHTYIRNCNWYTIYNPDIQSIPYKFKNRYTLLACKPHQVGINRNGQPLTRTLLQLYGGQKKPPRENPFGEKISQEIWVGTMAQTQSSWQPVLRDFTVKQNKFSN